MYPKAKYINIYEATFKSPNVSGPAGHTYATDGDKMLTIRLDAIVSIHTEKIDYSHHRYCVVTMSNNFRYNITQETAEQIRLCLDIESICERSSSNQGAEE